MGHPLSMAVKFRLSLIPDPQSGGLQRKRHFSQKLDLINVCESGPAFQRVRFQRGVGCLTYLPQRHIKSQMKVYHIKSTTAQVCLLFWWDTACLKENDSPEHKEFLFHIDSSLLCLRPPHVWYMTEVVEYLSSPSNILHRPKPSMEQGGRQS